MIFFITAIAITTFFAVCYGLNAPVNLWHLAIIVLVPMVISVIFDILTRDKFYW